MEQTRIESFLESTANTLSGFWISYAVWVALIYTYGKANVPDPLALTAIFTVTSMLRSYIWRRFFNKGVHKFIHNAVKEIYHVRVKRR